MNRKKAGVSTIIMYFILVFFGGIQIFPLLWLIDFSLLNNSDLFGPKILVWPERPRLENYAKAWIDGDIPRLFLNSLIVNAVTIILTVLLVSMLSYAFTRMIWKLRKLFFRLVITGLMIPIHVTLLPNFFTFSAAGLRNSYLGLIIPYTAFSLPIGVFLLSSYMESMSKAVEESAVIDGCGVWRIIFNIVVPLNKPALTAVVVTTFLNSWNEFIMAVTYLNDNRFRTLPFSVYNFAGRYSADYAVQFAVMAITALPTIILFIIFNEQMTKGIMLGSVKA
jgi:raffinose/stachyose/melibiose transport system permease protein